jgi:hypothetical protein
MTREAAPPEDAMLCEMIGWASSGLLVVTVANQVRSQWRAGSSHGVSRWLFVGQLAASIGFVVHSALVRNLVFVVTNALMLVNALVGYAVVCYHARLAARRGETAEPQ